MKIFLKMSCNLFPTSCKEGKRGHLDLIISLPLLTAGEKDVPFFFFFFFFLEVSLNTRVQLLCSFFFLFNYIWSLLIFFLISSDFFLLKVFTTFCRSHFLTV